MASVYDHKKIEKKWQKAWDKANIYKTSDASKKPKYYILDMFPYPSGEGLHVGHPKGYIATDVISRMKRMQGYNVLHPMGFDAFGLPAENYALTMKVHPEIAVKKNIKRFKEQLGVMGVDYDWGREINTTDPKYYKWTQWIFLQLFKKGLAYESNEPINWCPSCKTGLANEDLEAGRCERCGTLVEKKPLRQWVLKITDYAESLLKDLDAEDKDGFPLLNWPEYIKEMQRNWIGKSEGAEIEFPISESEEKIKVFTTRPDTIFGATYLVLAPEHRLVQELKGQITNWSEVENYIKQVKDKGDIDRLATDKEKTGVELKGIKVTNPANKKEISVWIADYVLGSYGTGAIMAVPADDERDNQFAVKFNLPIVIDYKKAGLKDYGQTKTTYKLRDWVFSRQRYWGEPIPLIHCEKCGVVPVLEKDLPVELPKVKSYEPTGTGESPLASISKWVNVKCPKCNGKAKRETNTMPQWAGSSWYYLRYMDPKNNKEMVAKKKEQYWNTVDLYVGGAEHATRHLIYARFWHKFLYDIKAISTREPFKKLQSVGLIMGPDGRKMSKRFGNIINPDDIVKRYGADTLRIYEMFIGPFDQAAAWSEEAIIGPRRFLEKVWRIRGKLSKSSSPSVEKLLHKTIKKVGEDINNMSFNTAVSTLMVCINEMDRSEVGEKDYKILLQILAPFASYMAEELWNSLGEKKSIHISKWPKWNPKLIEDTEVKIAVQVNGKVRAEIVISLEDTEKYVQEKALADVNVYKYTNGATPKKVIYVKGRLINILV